MESMREMVCRTLGDSEVRGAKDASTEVRALISRALDMARRVISVGEECNGQCAVVVHVRQYLSRLRDTSQFATTDSTGNKGEWLPRATLRDLGELSKDWHRMACDCNSLCPMQPKVKMICENMAEVTTRMKLMRARIRSTVICGIALFMTLIASPDDMRLPRSPRVRRRDEEVVAIGV